MRKILAMNFLIAIITFTPARAADLAELYTFRHLGSSCVGLVFGVVADVALAYCCEHETIKTAGCLTAPFATLGGVAIYHFKNHIPWADGEIAGLTIGSALFCALVPRLIGYAYYKQKLDGPCDAPLLHSSNSPNGDGTTVPFSRTFLGALAFATTYAAVGSGLGIFFQWLLATSKTHGGAVH